MMMIAPMACELLFSFFLLASVWRDHSCRAMNSNVSVTFKLSNQEILSPTNEWFGHFYIFVGGDHNTGTSVTERLLASQKHASGLRVNEATYVNHTEGCHLKRSNTTCSAPENEGVYVTDVFMNLYKSKSTVCKPNPTSSWGMCARKQKLTEKDIEDNTDALRQELLYDWSQFFDMNSLYLVEKDISNTVKSRFLQQLFGKDKTAFVFVMRHPLSSCKDFKCDVAMHIKSWLQTYTEMEADLSYLQVYTVFHLESLVHNTSRVIKSIRSTLGFDVFSVVVNNVLYHFTENATSTLAYPTSTLAYPSTNTTTTTTSSSKNHRLLGYHQDGKHVKEGN